MRGTGRKLDLAMGFRPSTSEKVFLDKLLRNGIWQVMAKAPGFIIISVITILILGVSCRAKMLALPKKIHTLAEKSLEVNLAGALRGPDINLAKLKSPWHNDVRNLSERADDEF